MELLTIVPWFMGTEDFGGIFMFTNMGVQDLGYCEHTLQIPRP